MRFIKSPYPARLLKSAIALFFLLVCSFTYSQNNYPALGYFAPEEINLTECSFDKEAEAVILLDEANTDYDDDYRLITYRRVRIKILNARGLDRATISIPFYSRDNFEYIDKIEGYTYNFDENGKPSSIALDRKSIFTEKKNNYYSLVKFAMPAIKPGSIIEYRYTSNMKHYGGLDEWLFQSDLPTLRSCYLLQILPRAEFAYQVQKKSSLYIIIKPIPGEGRIYFEMNNIPALRIEPYMDAPRDYIQKVSFQLSGVVNRFGDKQNINTTWKSLALDLMTEKDFGSQLDKDLKAEDVKALAQAEVTASGKLRVIYNYVRDHFSLNGYDSKFATGGLKKILEKKSGTSGEINLLLINLLNTNGIEVYPMLVAERDFGKIDPSYPFLDRFNKVVAFAIADGKQFILDATQKYSPAGLTPYQLLNTTAFLVDRKKHDLLKIASTNKSYRNKVSINATLDNKGGLQGNASIESMEYSKLERTAGIKENQKKFIEEHFEKPFRGLTVDSFMFVNLDSDSLPLLQNLKFSQPLDESGGFVFLNYNFFLGLEKNPFTSSIRFTNVNFGYPYIMSMDAVFTLPPGGKADLPENKMVQFENGKISLQREIKFENGKVHVKLFFTETITLIQPDNYPALKDFYKTMVDMLNEPVVVKVGN